VVPQYLHVGLVIRVLLGGTVLLACGSQSNGAGFIDAGSDASSTSSDSSIDSSGGDADTAGLPDGGLVGCSGLQCQWEPCSQAGKPETTLTGTVYDPAGNLPLYNVYVYVPNGTPKPIVPGTPTCTQCEAPATGNPIIGAQTDAQGHFVIQWKSGNPWGVPAGVNIPLVIQVGKWRKQLTIPLVTACETNDLDLFFGGSGKSRKLRLPANGSEGDMPLIAFTSGYDPAECFLRDIGIDDSEFVAPDTPGGPTNGHVHFFTGWDYNPSDAGINVPASSVAGGNTPQDTYQWWSSAANLLKYDIVFNACEGYANDRGAAAYAAMEAYLNGGGRLFTTHYYYNWFAAPTGPGPFQGVVEWEPENAWSSGNYYIDTSFPKGQAYGQWLLANGIATGSMANGIQIEVGDTRNDVGMGGMPMYADSTRWIYQATGPGTGGAPPGMYGTAYLTFNAPTTAPSDMQCGRAVFSDVHLSGNVASGMAFPTECKGLPDVSHAINEKALEFLFFDLSSCVQNDATPPPTPPIQ
jgi:hypothetical protein